MLCKLEEERGESGYLVSKISMYLFYKNCKRPLKKSWRGKNKESNMIMRLQKKRCICFKEIRSIGMVEPCGIPEYDKFN